jgi:hypothetical protein
MNSTPITIIQFCFQGIFFQSMMMISNFTNYNIIIFNFFQIHQFFIHFYQL